MSILINLTKNVWTQITTDDKDGFIRHHSGKTKVVYVEAETATGGLDSSVAVMRDTILGVEIQYSGVAKNNFVWAYAISADAVLSVTRNIGVSLNLNADYFNGLAGIIAQSYTEANSKLGTSQEASTYIPVVAGLAENDTIFLTGAKPVILKSRKISFTGIGVVAEIFEGPTYTGGAPAVYQNSNAINPVTGLTTIIVGATVTVDGFLRFAPVPLIGSASNQSRGAVGIAAGGEEVLKPNTAYLFRITSLDPANQAIASFLSWYEGVIDLPRP